MNEEGSGAPVPWFFTGASGHLLYAQRWEPWPQEAVSGAPRIVLAHGFGEHVGRYEGLGRALAASGRALWGYDIAGFGRSDGPRAVVESLGGALADLGKLVEAASGPDAPSPVLIGHSMGGAFAAAFAIEHPEAISALVLSAPAVHLSSRPSWQVVGARSLARALPRAGVGRVAPAMLSRDPEAVSAYTSDPLVWHGTVPARTAFEMYRAGSFVMKRAGELKVPVFIIHGESDELVPVASSRALFDLVGSNDKTIRVFRGLLHEPLSEVSRQEVIAIVLEWLARH